MFSKYGLILHRHILKKMGIDMPILGKPLSLYYNYIYALVTSK